MPSKPKVRVKEPFVIPGIRNVKVEFSSTPITILRIFEGDSNRLAVRRVLQWLTNREELHLTLIDFWRCWSR